MGRPHLAAIALLLGPTGALAADVDLFEPAGSLASGEGSLQGESPILGEEGFSGGLLAGFAQDPVIRRFADGGDVAPAVVALAPLHLQGGWTVEDTVRVDALLPLYAWVDAPLTGYQGAALGDLRVQATVPLWSSTDDTTHFAVVPRIGLPTGSTEALVARGFSADLLAALGGRVDDFGWVADAGFSLAANDPLQGSSPGLGSTFDVIGGAWVHVSESLRAGAEIDLSVGLAQGDEGTNNTGTAHAFAQNMLPSGVGLAVGAGTGLVAGVGTPEYRVFAALTYTATEQDQDHDGIVDNDDPCPTEAEDVDGFEDSDGCPEIDNDSDGILDLADSCPIEPEDVDGFQDRDGCPDPDNDDDSVLDAADGCPDVPGVPALGGCPDSDGDGLVDAEDRCPEEFGPVELEGCPDRDIDEVPDFRDACPDEPKPPDEDPATSDGCPKSVYVTATEIVITQRVEFETGKSKLTGASLPILDSVAAVMSENPRVSKLEVQGHTDNVGSDSYNLRLSQQRAAAVVAYLASAGVDAARLASQGYGESTPMFSNRTPKGREGNRRVQFKILEQTTPEPRPEPSTSGAMRIVPIQPVEEGDIANPWGTIDEPDEDDDSPWGEVIEPPP